MVVSKRFRWWQSLVVVLLASVTVPTNECCGQEVRYVRHIPANALFPWGIEHWKGEYYSLHNNGLLVRYSPKKHDIVPVVTPRDEYIVDVFVANHRLWIRSRAGRLWSMGDSPGSWELVAKGVTATFVDVRLQLTYAAADSVVSFKGGLGDDLLTRATRVITGVKDPVCVAVSGDTTLIGVGGDNHLRLYVGTEERLRLELSARLNETTRLYSDARSRVLFLPGTGQPLQLQRRSIADGFLLLEGEYSTLSARWVRQVVKDGRPLVVCTAFNPMENRRDIFVFDEEGDSLRLLLVDYPLGVRYQTVAFGNFDTVLVSDAGRYTLLGGTGRESVESVVPGYSNTSISIGGSAVQPMFLRRVNVASQLSGLLAWTHEKRSQYLFSDSIIRAFVGSFDHHIIRIGPRMLIIGPVGIALSDDEGVSWDTIFRPPARIPAFQAPAHRMVDGGEIIVHGPYSQVYISTDSGRSWRTHVIRGRSYGHVRNMWCNAGTFAAHVSGLGDELILTSYLSIEDTLRSRRIPLVFGNGLSAIAPAGQESFVIAKLLATDTSLLDFRLLEISIESVDSTLRTETIDLGDGPIWGFQKDIFASRPHVGRFGDTISVFFPVMGRLIRILNGVVLDDRNIPRWMIAPLDGASQSYVEFTTSSSMRAFTNLDDGIEMFIDYEAEYQEPVSLVDTEVEDALYHVFVKTIAPNPAMTDVHISVGHHLRSDMNSLVVRIHDMEGRLIKNVDWHNSIVSQDPYELVVKTDVSGLPSGPYVLVVENSQFTHGKVIVVQR
jgi:hypothetical protein